MPRYIDADVFDVVTFEGKSEEFLDGADYILTMIDAQPTVDVVNAIFSDLRDAIKPLTVDRLLEYPRSSHQRLNEIVAELETKYLYNNFKRTI